MNPIRPTHAILMLMLLSILALTACSQAEIYDAAIGYERRLAGLESRHLEVDDFTIAYLSNGEVIANAPTIVMIHGFGANKDHWLRMAAHLTADYNVYAIDLPGHGDSSKPLDIGYSISDQVGYLDRILRELVLDNIHLAGNSMGGAIAALYAATYPGNVRSATLFDPAGVLEFDSELMARILQGENPLIVEKPGDFEKLLDFALEKKPYVPWPIYSVMEQRAIANQPVNERIFADIRDSGYQPDFREALKHITAPVLIVWGREDRVINYRNAKAFQREIPQSKVVIMDDVGHAPMVEVPGQSAELMRELIEGSATNAP
ncbi:alpha/beta fold hydrolase [Marinobacter changyiensis]|uniref:alpha/beta fold hydrolase n=1 Tax=Marinobacter changyiensis TaxID=2604091 RepID=UPI0012655D48|nr:alpha/beta hydrolase [Marinobacter changyiensis]